MATVWIWTEKARRDVPEMVHFRKNINIEKIIEPCHISISADSRYVLYINGEKVSVGPCRAPLGVRYSDEVDITKYIKVGNNLVYAKVIRYSDQKYDINDFCSGPVSVVTEGVGGFIIEETQSSYGFDTSSGYEARPVPEYLFSKKRHAGYLGFFEEYDASCFKTEYSDTEFMQSIGAIPEDGWKPAVAVKCSEYTTPGGIQNFWMLTPCTIPQPYEKQGIFKSVWLRCSDSSDIRDDDTVTEKTTDIFPLAVEAGKRVCIELVTDHMVTAYPVFYMCAGKGAELTVTYAESYARRNKDGIYEKGIRDLPYGQGVYGQKDTYISAEGCQKYSPFYYRSFRIIRIEINNTSDKQFVMMSVSYNETGYPLKTTGSFLSDEPEINTLWDISLRTLKCCMYETFMDCPHYEQMQYTMDTFLEMRYAFCISSDGRLARKAILDFAGSQLKNGLMPCNAPAKITQVIPGFSIYWIFMLETYMLYQGDIAFIRSQLGHMDRILQYFSSCLDSGNILSDTGYWQFFDWAEGWERGCPVSETDRNTPNVLYTLLYVCGLRSAARLCSVCGREDTEREYILQAEEICAAVKSKAYDAESGLFSDIPGQKPKSQHAQIFAVLAGAVSDAEKRNLMERMLKNDKQLAATSYAMSYFMCRALEQTGLYSELHAKINMWNKFRNLTKLHLTTWPEDFITMRSDCHGWSALPIYEFISCYLGIQPVAPGFKKAVFCPQHMPFGACRGIVPTPYGDITVDIKPEYDGCTYAMLQVPKSIEVCTDLLTEKGLCCKIVYI